MKGGGGRQPLAVRLYAALLCLYPPAFGAEYGDEMLQTFRAWSGREERGALGVLRF